MEKVKQDNTWAKRCLHFKHKTLSSVLSAGRSVSMLPPNGIHT